MSPGVAEGGDQALQERARAYGVVDTNVGLVAVGHRTAGLVVDPVATVRVNGGGRDPGDTEIGEVDVAADRPGTFARGVELYLHQVKVGCVTAEWVRCGEVLAGLRVVQLQPDRPVRDRTLQAQAKVENEPIWATRTELCG